MDKTPSKPESISNLREKADEISQRIAQFVDQDYKLTDDKSFYNLEITLHKMTKELADTITGIKLQEHLAKSDTTEEEKKIS